MKSPQLQQLIAVAVMGAENLTSIITGKSGNIAAPVFLTSLQATLGVLQAEGKISVDEANALTAAVQAVIVADQQAQQVVDPNALKPIAPLA